jgi:alkylation response protein AidB-like acyl-CoA dehydrogenase
MSTTISAPATGFTEEQLDFRAAIADFCERELGTKEQREAATQGYTELHNQAIYEQLAELGWLGVSIDEAYGGSGGGIVDACIFLEGFMRGRIPIAGYGVSLIVAGAYQRFGTSEQKEEILGGITRGRVEAIAMSEPEAGSDVGNLSCRAERQNGGFVLNGQ